MTEPRIVFMGMELAPEEVVKMLLQASTICSLMGGIDGANSNRKTVMKMATEFQLTLLRKMEEPGRVLVTCATCGTTRNDVVVVPEGDAGYLRIPNPLAAEKPPERVPVLAVDPSRSTPEQTEANA